MIDLNEFIQSFPLSRDIVGNLQPWEITANIADLLRKMIPGLGRDYMINGYQAIHRSAIIESGAVIKDEVIIGAGCFVGSCAYLRSGVFLGEHVTIGPGCEIKSGIIAGGSTIAHFNFIGNSLIGNLVNFEAGSVIANHFNERENKRIFVRLHNKVLDTGVEKFGALVGDHCKIGANAVLSPGTILGPGSIVRRLELIQQM